MLRLIPAPLHRAAYRVAHFLRCKWLRQRGGTVYGCAVVARDGEGRLLLVRHSYGPDCWEFPAGARRRSESAEATARREFREEVGCAIEEVAHLGQVAEPYHGATNVVDVFTGRIEGEPRADGREIVEVGLFAPESLPAPLGVTARRRLEMLHRVQNSAS